MLLLQLDIRKMLIYVNFSLKYEVFINLFFKNIIMIKLVCYYILNNMTTVIHLLYNQVMFSNDFL